MKSAYWILVVTLAFVPVMSCDCTTRERASVERALRCHLEGMGSLRECFELEEVDDWLPEQNKDPPEKPKCPSFQKQYKPGTLPRYIRCMCYDYRDPPMADPFPGDCD